MPVGVAGPVAAAPDEGAVAVIVQGRSAAAASAAVADLGGTVGRTLDLVDGVAATVAPSAAASLARAGFAVAPDAELAPTSVDTEAAADAIDDRHVQLQAVNPGESWSGSAGAGVGVALIDTGVDASSTDLEGRLELGPDFSEDGTDDAGTDGFGHGTFMAGLIAGDGSASGGEHVGVAPGAHVVAVKVAGADGETNLSRVLGAIDWVIEHQDEHRIGVLNLSFGVVSRHTRLDPLVQAVDAAWASGITVVAAVGNEGRDVVTSPGWSPWVITSGATNVAGTATTTDDVVPAWSGTARVNGIDKPDLLAPGDEVVSLRVPDSTIDPREPGSADAYITGHGTSMAAAMVSGAAAVYLAEHPTATPWAVKRAFTATSAPVSGSTAGTLDLDASLDAGPDVDDASLGVDRLGPVPGYPGATYDDPSTVWSGTRWSGTRWSGTRWSGTRWSGTRWSGTRWSGTRWSSEDWSGTRWSGTRWSGTRWSGTRWSGTRWSGEEWSGTRWSGTRWSGTRWSGTRWSGAAWGAAPT